MKKKTNKKNEKDAERQAKKKLIKNRQKMFLKNKRRKKKQDKIKKKRYRGLNSQFNTCYVAKMFLYEYWQPYLIILHLLNVFII